MTKKSRLGKITGMAEKEKTGEQAESAEQKERIALLRAAVEKKLQVLLSHPLVPQEFKDVFED